MKKLFYVSIIIAIAAAFFASSHPDGLDFVSEKFGFSEKGQERGAVMAGYAIPHFSEGRISSSLAGVAGVLITLSIFWLAVFVIKKRKFDIKRNIILLSFSVVLISLPVFAARPLVTDDIYTVFPGGYELEIGYSTTQNQASSINSANLSIKRGILSNVDLGIEVPYTMSTPSGLNDVFLHAKYRFWEGDAAEGLTARVDYKFNNGNINQGLGSGDSDYGFLLIGSKMFGLTKTHFNVGYVLTGVNAGIQSDDYIAYTLALEQPVWGEKGEVVAEYVANNAAQPNPAFIQLGARYIVSSGLKIDAGYSKGLNSNSIKNSATVGVHWEI
ncbi:MAG: PDGLE domain-containing protein [Candidatus Margulisiibacteriota bacterium]